MLRLPSGLLRITLRRLLLLRLAGILLLLIMLGASCAMLLTKADQRIQSVVGGTLAPISDVGRIQSDFNNDFQALSHAVLMRLPSAANDAATALKSNRVDIDRYWKPLLQSGLGMQQKTLLAVVAKRGLGGPHRRDEPGDAKRRRSLAATDGFLPHRRAQGGAGANAPRRQRFAKRAVLRICLG
jgi:hypothetical protein